MMNGRLRHHRRMSSAAQSGPNSSMHSIAGSDPQASSHKDGIRYSISSRGSDGWGTASNTSTCVDLKEVTLPFDNAFQKHNMKNQVSLGVYLHKFSWLIKQLLWLILQLSVCCVSWLRENIKWQIHQQLQNSLHGECKSVQETVSHVAGEQ